jgi:hypothetical protein
MIPSSPIRQTQGTTSPETMADDRGSSEQYCGFAETSYTGWMTSVTRKHLVLLLNCCITVRHVYLPVLYHLVCEVILKYVSHHPGKCQMEVESGLWCVAAVLAIACLMGKPLLHNFKPQPTPPLPTPTSRLCLHHCGPFVPSL